MKAFSLICSFILFSIICVAQDFNKDSTIVIENQKLYTVAAAPTTENLSIKGQIDAERNYKKYKGASVGTLITSLVSPLIGLIPAIACSASTPKIQNLGYPSEELFRQADYHKSYTKKAKKIKQGKVWKNWGIGLGVNLVIILLVGAS
ncbi:hypothetical protein [Dyadobacter sp. NIV53]|uniref:hypothetical protein n=1 Tax=Dyadobacter sp. NIV53 TaxID=2861765 RepID=UPI001C888387|nr:hypothetical protein [Dyadobacter sp. NIV53]